MNTLTITIGIVAPVITFLIGRYFRAEATKILMDTKQQHISFWKGLYEEQSNSLQSLNEHIEGLAMHNESIRIENASLTTQNAALLAQISNIAFVQIVRNINPHHAADKEYIGIYPNNGLEPAHLTREEYQKGVDRLKENPEDNILTKPVK
jgi:hypothetical protein